MKNKLRVRVRQLENELEQTLKKIDIVSRAKGFSKGRSSSITKVKRTEFRNSSGRKPLYPGGSNYSSPAMRSNSNRRVNNFSPANKSNGSNVKRNSPSAVSTGSKKRVSKGKSSNKGSPGNRLYSPSGRPREHSPSGGQRKPGAVDRIQEAFSPKSKNKVQSKAEIYKRYNGLRNSKDRKSGKGSNASPTNVRPGTGSTYSNQRQLKGSKKSSANRSNSAHSRKNSKSGTNHKAASFKYNFYTQLIIIISMYYQEQEVKLSDTSEKKIGRKLKENESMGGSFKEDRDKQISDVEAKIKNLEEMLRMAKA